MIRVLEWRQAAFLILMVLITVAAIDAVSQPAARGDHGPADDGRRAGRGGLTSSSAAV